MTITTNVIEIGPETAKNLLATSQSNFRPLNKDLVSKYARAMSQGRWRDNGGSIRFDQAGALIDGQHRLNAIIRSGTCQKVVAIHGCATDEEIDTCRSRSPSDHLRHVGVQNFKHVAGIARFVASFDAGLSLYDGKAMSLVSAADVVECVQRPGHERLFQRVVELSAAASVSSGRSQLGFIYFLGLRARLPAADLFVEQMQGVGLAKTTPALHLIKRLTRDKTTQGSLSRNQILALIVKAWNLTLEGREVRLLKLDFNDPYPKPMLDDALEEAS